MAKSKGQRRRNKSKDAPDEIPSLPPLLQRIKHADKSTRLATLTAIPPSRLTTRELLAAVRDRMLDDDLYCSMAAIQLLGDFLLLGRDFELTVQWTPIVLQQLSTTTNTEQQALLLTLLCRLMEENPLTVDKINTKNEWRQSMAHILRSLVTEHAALTGRAWHAYLQENPMVETDVEAHLRECLIKCSMERIAQLHYAGALWAVQPASSQDQVMDLIDAALQYSVPSAQIQALHDAYQVYATGNEDAELERDVLQRQEKLHESARSIARRLQNNPREHAGKINHEDRKDPCQIWNDLKDEFQDQILQPLQLALELAANIISETVTAPSTTLLQRIWHTLGQLILQFSDLPPPLQMVVGQIQATAAAAIANAVARGCTEALPSDLWQHLQVAASSAQVPYGLEGVVSAMVVLLRQDEATRKAIKDADLNFVLELLKQSNSDIVVQDAVTMLGILCCQETHDERTNENICQALMNTTMTRHDSMAIQGEVLNVLMDIYGDDDRHPAVFERCQGLQYFQQSLPLLKQLISKEKNLVDTEEWEEVALNAGRFIQYKKAQSV